MVGPNGGWFTDPTGRHLYRYWDGNKWSSRVSDGGASGTDPAEIDPDMMAIPPAPGSQAPSPQQTQPAVQVSQKTGGFGLGAIFGVLVALVAVVILVVVILANVGSDSTTTTTEVAPTTTAAP